MSTLGWLASTASSVFVCTTLVQSLVAITETDFLFPNWQYTLIMLAFLVITIFFNTWGAGSLPSIETMSLFGHLACFFVVTIPVLVMCPKNSAKEVFTSVVDKGGWGNVGTACLVAQVSVLYCNLGTSASFAH
jgi:choline transport protein